MARNGEAPLARIAKDFGLAVATMKRWISIAEELKKRNRLLEQENEMLRRAAAYSHSGGGPAR